MDKPDELAQRRRAVNWLLAVMLALLVLEIMVIWPQLPNR